MVLLASPADKLACPAATTVWHREVLQAAQGCRCTQASSRSPAGMLSTLMAQASEHLESLAAAGIAGVLSGVDLPRRDRGRMQGASLNLTTTQGWRWCSGYITTAGEGPAAMLSSS